MTNRGPQGETSGASRAPGRLPQELQELARRAPDRLPELLSGLSMREQAHLALQLPPKERLEILLHSPKPMRLVRTLPDGELYLTVREVGPAEALPLLSMASASQIVHLLDLESWRRDQFDAKRSGAWTALLLESGEATLRRFIRKADDELLVLLFQRWMRVRQIDTELEPDKQGTGETEAGTKEGFVTPDGYHRFRPVIAEHAAAMRRFAELLIQESPERYQRLLWSAQWELPSEVEEQELRWRQSRLEEHGFPAREDALDVYAPPAGLRHSTDLERDVPPGPRSLSRLRDAGGPLQAAAAQLDDADRDRLLLETTAVANRLIVADSTDPGDPDAHARALRKTASFVTIALAVRGALDGAAAARVLKEIPLKELFREGYHQAVAVQARAKKLVSDGWAAAHPRALDLLDSPLRSSLAGLLQPRPLHFDGLAGSTESAFREFESLGEIAEAAAAVRLADVLGRITVERLGLDICALLDDGSPTEDPPRLSAIFLTALAWGSTRGELRCEPLPSGVTSQFLRTVASRRTADPEAPARALESFLACLSDEANLRPEETATLGAFGRACLKRLDEECSRLDPACEVDPRYVSCLLLAKDPCPGRSSASGSRAP